MKPDSGRRFLIAEMIPAAEASGLWPWIRLAPRGWRTDLLRRFAQPRAERVLSNANTGVLGQVLALPEGCREAKTVKAIIGYQTLMAPAVYGWSAADRDPIPAEFPWRTGRLFAVLSCLAPFRHWSDLLGDPSGLGVMLLGGNQPELAVLGRCLARWVRFLIIVCREENFRNRLAEQILAESGLAAVTRSDIPARGWDIAIELRRFPPLLVLRESATVKPTALFPEPLYPQDGTAPAREYADPVWQECHLCCLAPADAAPPPAAVSVGAILAMLAIADRAGIGFSFSSPITGDIDFSLS